MPDGISIPGGPSFIGFPQPPDVPCDPTGDGWRGPQGFPGQTGPQGVPGVPGVPGTGSFSVLDAAFGAVGDGATDNTAAIQAAIDAAAGNGALRFPATNGAVYMTDTLYIPSNTHLIIEAGATLLLKPNANHNLLNLTDDRINRLLGVNHVYIELRGALDGNSSTQLTAGGSGGIVSSGVSTNIYIDGFEQGLITNFHNWPVNIVRCTNAEVRNLAMTNSGNSCEFAGFTTGGVTTKCYNVGFTNCYVKDIRDLGLVLYGGCENSYIRDCYLDGSSASIFMDSGQPGVNVDCEISGCHRYNGFGAIGTNSNLVGVNNRNCRVFNNTIGNVETTGLVISAVDYCEVYGNLIHDTGASFANASGQSGQVSISGTTHVNFSGNTIRNTTNPGYYSREVQTTISITPTPPTYNPTTGAVSLITATAHGIAVGGQFYVQNAFGSGSYLSLNGWQTATAGTTGTTLNFTAATGLTLTIKSGTIRKYTPAAAVTIASGTYDPSTGNVVLTTSAPHGMPMTGGVPQPFVVSGIAGTGAVANLNGYQTATTGTAGSTINCTTTAGLGAITITGGTVMPPTFGVSVTQADYCRITNNHIGDWQTTKNMVACIGGQWGTDCHTEGNIYGPRLATGPLFGYPADAMVYAVGSGNTQGASYDTVQDIYYGTSASRNITTQTFFPNKGLTLGWNLNSGKGEVDFLCGREAGAPGGFSFWQIESSGTINTSVGIAGSLLANDGYGNTQLGGALVHGKMQTVASLANAGTVTVNQHTSMVLIRNSASIATATIAMPATATSQYATGAELELNFQNPIGAVTWSPSISGAPTSIATAGASVNFINSGTVWLRRIAI